MTFNKSILVAKYIYIYFHKNDNKGKKIIN